MELPFQTSPGRIFALDGNGEILAEVTFPTKEDGVAEIDHTFVAPALRGQGIADKLLQAAADTLRAEGKKARLVCSYAVTWFDRHPEYEDVRAE